MKQLILILVFAFLITGIGQAQNRRPKTDEPLDIKSKAKELGINPELLKQMIRNSDKNGVSDDPDPESMSSSYLLQPSGNFGVSVSSAGDVNGDGINDIIVGAYTSNTFTGKAYLYYGGTTISPTPDLTFYGEAVNNYFGFSVSKAGDVNGDGFGDIIIGAYGYNSGVGRAYIYYGGPVMNNVPDQILNGESGSFGYSVSFAGDVNNDGFSDVIVGASDYSTQTGRAYIYYGGAPMNNIADVTMTGDAVISEFGCSVAGAGDVNGDGYSDVIIGARSHSNSTGFVYIYYGGAAMNNIVDVLLIGETLGSRFGFSVSGAGDFNGDGYADVIVGAIGYGTNVGRSYIYYGSPAMDNIADLTLTGESSNNFFGISVAAAGDINGDGYSDIICGAYGFSSNTGKAYIFYGGSNPDNIADNFLIGDLSNSQFGTSVAGLGDINNDGFSDLIIGAPNSNRAYIFRNGMTGFDSPDLTINEAGSNQLGRTVACVGDVNGDGYDDIAIGSPASSSLTGKVNLYFGGPALDAIPDVTFNGEGANGAFGLTICAAGDVNGDGYNDILIAAPYFLSNKGKVYIFFGGNVVDNTFDVTFIGDAVNNFLGSSASSGDINKDGYSDILLGEYSANSFAGKVMLYYGGSPMNNVADVTFTGAAANDEFGYSVACTGDVNGDGYPDILIGATQVNSSAGRAYLFFGGINTDLNADLILDGAAAGDNFGYNVSGCGDLNGDGFNDFAIGTNSTFGEFNHVYIYYGGSPVNNAADVILTSGSFENLGSSISKAGDVNGDGYDDLAVSASNSNSGTGKVFIFFGGYNMDNTADVIMQGENINDFFGQVVSAGDFNGDGLSDIVTGASQFNSQAGRGYIFLSSSPVVKPSLLKVTDVPNDQGGKVLLRWSRSGYEQSGLVTGYDIFRSAPPVNGVFSWQQLTHVSTGAGAMYSYSADTYNDSVAAGIQKTYFRITARTAVNSQSWTSNIQSGYSIDNLAPPAPNNLAALSTSSVINLNWDDAYAPDLSYYKIYRNGSVYNTSTVSQFTDNSVNGNSSYTYKVSAVDIHGNESNLSAPVISSIAIKLSLKIFLEGAFSGTVNRTDLSDAGLIPLSSPYGTGETVSAQFLSAHLNITDWIRIDLRQTETGNLASRRSFFLLADGSLLDTNGAGFSTFYGVSAGNYFVVVSHRNHLSVMTPSFVALSTVSFNYDFTTGLDKYYGGDAKNLSGRFGMYSGDGNGDGAVDNSDKNTIWRPNNGQAGYLRADFNLDGSVDNIDKNIKWRPNNGKATNVP